VLLAASLTASAQMPRAEDRHDEQRHSHGGEDGARAEDALGFGAQHVAAQSDADHLLGAFALLAFGVALFARVPGVAVLGLALAVWSVVALGLYGLVAGDPDRRAGLDASRRARRGFTIVYRLVTGRSRAAHSRRRRPQP